MRYITLLLAIAGCTAANSTASQAHLAPTSGTAPPKITLVRLTEIPPEWHVWWREIEDCAKIRAPLDSAIEKVYVYLGDKIPLEGTADSAGGVFNRDIRQLWVARPYLAVREIVAHEFMHAILWTRKIRGHPSYYFGPRCGLAPTEPGR